MLSPDSSRSHLRMVCAALVLATAAQALSLTASAAEPRNDLDELAYGNLAAPPTSARPANRAFTVNRPQAQMTSNVGAETAPRAVAVEAPMRAPRPAPPHNAGGLLAALGLDVRTSSPKIVPAPALDPAPMEAKAELPTASIRPAPASRFATPPVPAVPVIVVAPAAPTSVSYAAPAIVPVDLDYRVDAGDKLRVVVFGQEGLTNTYAIDAGGGITMPLIGRVVARGMTPAGLAAHITARLRKGFIREPSVAVEVEAYRPFFILGEVAAPGQYPYVPNMSVEAAVAIAGGFSPRARRDSVTLTHRADGGQMRAAVPLGTPINPGDTIMVSERWF